MPLSPTQITNFQKKILSWYEKNKRDLPWRDLPFDPVLKQRDPYKILVSEVMAQQTQLTRVISKYEAWIRRFPTIESLALAPTREVLLYWSGLGYNRRALNLQRTAWVIVGEFGGVFPRTYDALVKLPGIGKYTANALLCFAFNQQVAVVDTNVRKVILLEVLKESKEPKEPKGDISAKEIEEIAKQLLPKGKVLRLGSGRSLNATAYEWNQALMDYAAFALKKEKIFIPKQSHFKSSDRYYRGQIVKKLVRDLTVTQGELAVYFEKHNPIESDRLGRVLKKLEEDGLIRIKSNTIEII